MFKNATSNEDGILEISSSELNQNHSKVELIDVRRLDEFTGELGHISGAKLVTLETDFKEKAKTLDPNKTYVFVCRSGVRSSKAALYATTLGVKNVYNLKGGMLAWNSLNLPVERS